MCVGVGNGKGRELYVEVAFNFFSTLFWLRRENYENHKNTSIKKKSKMSSSAALLLRTARAGGTRMPHHMGYYRLRRNRFKGMEAKDIAPEKSQWQIA